MNKLNGDVDFVRWVEWMFWNQWKFTKLSICMILTVMMPAYIAYACPGPIGALMIAFALSLSILYLGVLRYVYHKDLINQNGYWKHIPEGDHAIHT